MYVTTRYKVTSAIAIQVVSVYVLAALFSKITYFRFLNFSLTWHMSKFPQHISSLHHLRTKIIGDIFSIKAQFQRNQNNNSKKHI
jgi:hypothetical protein